MDERFMLKLKELREKWHIENALYGEATDTEHLISYQAQNNITILMPDHSSYFRSASDSGYQNDDLF